MNLSIAKQINEAADYYESENYIQAFALYLKLSDQGDIESMVMLGWMYQEGLGAEANIEKAKKWFSQASSLGSLSGDFYLGKLLYNGKENTLDRQSLNPCPPKIGLSAVNDKVFRNNY